MEDALEVPACCWQALEAIPAVEEALETGSCHLGLGGSQELVEGVLLLEGLEPVARPGLCSPNIFETAFVVGCEGV